MLYVPVVWFDDSEPIVGDFPDVNDPQAVSDYYFNPQQLGAVFLQIEVDGQITELGPEYVAGAATPGLPTGGNNYTVAAAFLTPLAPGTHTIKIRGLFSGAALGEPFAGEVVYSVTVR